MSFQTKISLKAFPRSRKRIPLLMILDSEVTALAAIVSWGSMVKRYLNAGCVSAAGVTLSLNVTLLRPISLSVVSLICPLIVAEIIMAKESEHVTTIALKLLPCLRIMISPNSNEDCLRILVLLGNRIVFQPAILRLFGFGISSFINRLILAVDRHVLEGAVEAFRSVLLIGGVGPLVKLISHGHDVWCTSVGTKVKNCFDQVNFVPDMACAGIH